VAVDVQEQLDRPYLLAFIYQSFEGGNLGEELPLSGVKPPVEILANHPRPVVTDENSVFVEHRDDAETSVCLDHPMVD